ncbi:MAG: hypothetical protein K2W96_00255 [Gemmataceae bacterium]|nr:hypothetical protein [Gemmataceae bacterium]
MGDRRPKKRSRAAKPSAPRDVFAGFGLDAAEFLVRALDGMAFPSHQRFVKVSVKHLPTGRVVSAAVEATKKGKDRQREALLRRLLQSFLPSASSGG